MELISTTPFGARPVTADLIARESRRRRASATGSSQDGEAADKWAILRKLAIGRAAFGVSDRDLAVLSALLSFHPARAIEAGASGPAVIVHPSNASLRERSLGMAESTLRRHLAALVAAGLIRRHDSPNGKRYRSQDADGGPVRAFGFDLSPLAARGAEIEAAAAAVRQAQSEERRLRELVSLRLRDAEKLVAYGSETTPGAADWASLAAQAAECRRASRRRLSIEELRALATRASDLATEVEGGAGLPRSDPRLEESEKMSGNATANERLHQNSNTDSHDSEFCLESRKKRWPDRGETIQSGGERERTDTGGSVRRPLTLRLVLDACPELQLYAREPIRSWRDLVGVAEFVRPLMGVSADAWSAARAAMGDELAAATLAGILERSGAIASPGGYLRSLTGRARGSGFSPVPMLSALLSTRSGSS